jgi:hypothetical protein
MLLAHAQALFTGLQLELVLLQRAESHEDAEKGVARIREALPDLAEASMTMQRHARMEREIVLATTPKDDVTLAVEEAKRKLGYKATESEVEDEAFRTLSVSTGA